MGGSRELSWAKEESKGRECKAIKSQSKGSMFGNHRPRTLDLRGEGLVGLEEEQHRGHEEVVHDGEGEGLEAGEEVERDGGNDGEELQPQGPPACVPGGTGALG